MRTSFFVRAASFVLVLILLASGPLRSQQHLQQYIEQALKNNVVLQQKNIEVEKALYDLKTARSFFLPSVDFQGAYQSGEGGRSIAIPVGDLLNPVYSTLNQLTSSNAFPSIKNVETNFLPHNFYDAKIVATVPVINRSITYNKQIRQQQYQLQQTDADLYKRELVKNIKIAYFNYIMALRSVAICESALSLANEGKRTNEKLLANGKGLPAYVLRAESEVASVSARLNDARIQSENARMYFNFLLNTDLKDPVDTLFNVKQAIASVQQDITVDMPVDKREELRMLQQSVNINQTLLKMNKSFWYPKLNGFLNVGSQSSNWKADKNTAYYFGGLQLDVPIFQGKRNQYKIRQTELEIKNARISLDDITQQLKLSASVAKNNLQSGYSNYLSSLKQLEAASAYQRLIERGYKEGVNSFIETVDARNQLTSAQLLVNINEFKVLAAAANLERETASYNIHP